MKIKTLLENATSSDPKIKYPAIGYLVEHQNVADIDLLDHDPHMYPWRHTLHGYQQGGKIIMWGHAENLKTDEHMPVEVEPELIDAANLDTWIDDHIANINGVSAHPCKNTEYFCNSCDCETLRQQLADASGEHAKQICAAVKHRFLNSDPAKLLDAVKAELIITAHESSLSSLREQNQMLRQMLYQ